jgi:NADH-quinone oxidoreductase subunit J
MNFDWILGLDVKQLVFYGFSCISVIAALMVISAKNSVRAVLFLVLTFVATAPIWLLLESEFLAIALILVYVGAVMVLFLFVVMMLDLERGKIKASFARHFPIGFVVGGLVIAGLIRLATLDGFGLEKFPIPAPKPAGYSHIQVLGEELFTKFLLPFEIAGVILLVAIIAAIAITFRGSKGSRKQSPSAQVRVRKEDRLKILQLKSESQSL